MDGDTHAFKTNKIFIPMMKFSILSSALLAFVPFTSGLDTMPSNKINK